MSPVVDIPEPHPTTAKIEQIIDRLADRFLIENMHLSVICAAFRDFAEAVATLSVIPAPPESSPDAPTPQES